jgi:hypothetical protein
MCVIKHLARRKLSYFISFFYLYPPMIHMSFFFFRVVDAYLANKSKNPKHICRVNSKDRDLCWCFKDVGILYYDSNFAPLNQQKTKYYLSARAVTQDWVTSERSVVVGYTRDMRDGVKVGEIPKIHLTRFCNWPYELRLVWAMGQWP